VQVIAASILILFGIKTKIIYIGSFLNLVVTFVWIIGITNSFNLLDILDGLAGGTAFIIGLSVLVFSIFNFDIRVMLLSLIIIGVVLGFLVYNFPPAKIYLGNSGSHFLGFILSAVAIYISYAPLERKVALFSPILILGFPIFDTAFLIFMRAKQGRSAFKKSKDHFALRFLKLGYSKETTLFLMLILTLFFSLAGVFISQSANLLGIAIIVAVSLISLILTFRIGAVKIDG
jgi:UDP-GlcNAc:undecaprenyl-phosphate GlcNAc-1-phosphate transferase